jgi:hypothetical protein
MEAETPSDWDFWRQGLNREFLQRAYRGSTMVGAVAALVAVALDQRPVAIGLAAGVVMAVFSVWTCELAVRLLFRNGGGFAGARLAIAAVVKMPAVLGLLVGIAWACTAGIMNAFGVIGGVLLVHGTMFALAASTALASQDSNTATKR